MVSGPPLGPRRGAAAALAGGSTVVVFGGSRAVAAPPAPPADEAGGEGAAAPPQEATVELLGDTLLLEVESGSCVRVLGDAVDGVVPPPRQDAMFQASPAKPHNPRP